jgi:hypothetical protein
MNRNDYSESHRLAQAEKLVDGFLYPSCRDPEQGLCAAIYEIKCFDKDVKREWNVHFEYNSQTKSVTWNRHEILDITVAWNQVQ